VFWVHSTADELMKYAIIALDVGKTNKKIVVYDDEMRHLAFRIREIGTIRVEGFDVEDVDAIFKWFLGELKEFGRSFPIRVITVSAQGATAVCVGADGRPSLPPIAYTNEVDVGVHKRFWATMGDVHELQRLTATAEIKPLINLGKLLWFQKEHWPEDFEQTVHVLFFPQFFSYLLSGVASADITYTGCHTFLWDYSKNKWSFVVDKLGIRDMLPESPGLPHDGLGCISAAVASETGLATNTLVTLGIHDSNASLIPYLISQKEDFLLNSTGTWCVAMHPVKTVEFAPEELGKMVYYNLSYRGDPVKTSILLGGLEYSFYSNILMKRHGRSDWPIYDPAMYSSILKERQSFIFPTLMPGTGQFPNSMARVIDEGEVFLADDLVKEKQWPRVFENYLRGFALANLSLAIQTRVALRRVGLVPGTKMFIEGGFRHNKNYLALLGALLPDNPIYVTTLEEATSFGSALCAKSLVDGVALPSLAGYVNLNKQLVQPAALLELENYADAFMEYLDN